MLTRSAFVVAFLFTLAALPSAQGQTPKRTKPFLGVGGCHVTGMAHDLTFVPGTPTPNTLVTTADPDTRRFLVYVPSTYAARTAPLPLVYMLHGTAQTSQAIMSKRPGGQPCMT